MEARQAIGDSGQTQRRIQTLRGRGYRFVGAVEERTAAAAPLQGAGAIPRSPAPIGHAGHTGGARHRAGTVAPVVCGSVPGAAAGGVITGEVGIGKTTLVDAFVTAGGRQQPTSGSAGASVLSTTARGRRICRCWRLSAS